MAGGINLYQYASNNPLNYIDPFGLSKKKELVRGGYRFAKYPGDKAHGGDHWHVYKEKSNKLLGRMSGTGKTLTGNISNKAKKIAKKTGLIGALFTIYEVYDAATATKAEAFENIMEMIEDWPKDLQKELIEDMLKNNPDFFEEEYIDSWRKKDCP